MRVIQVHADGLQAWSAQCATVAGELAARAPVAAGSLSGQATAGAVAASETITTTAAHVLTARVQATATKAGMAASSYVQSDEQSAQRLAALAPVFVAV